MVCRNIDYDAVHTVHPQLVCAITGIPAVQCVSDTDAADGSFVAPFRKLLSNFNTGMFDFSVLLAFFAIEFAEQILTLLISNLLL